MKDVRTQSSVEYIRKAFGVDISDRERRQLTPEMVHVKTPVQGSQEMAKNLARRFA